ncbi:MAG: TolC family protein [Candidatus Eremiobacteraeota bacterium]|nr:TolC family protein [Candidatus Eremiobacteraeota bacterium]
MIVWGGMLLFLAASVLSLTQVQQEALLHSPSLREGESKVRESRYKVDEAYTLVHPTLQLTASGTRITPPVAFGIGGQTLVTVQPEYNYSAGVSLRQTLLTFGRLRWAAASAELNEKAVQADLQDRRLRVLEEASVAYYEALASAEQVHISEDQLKARQAHLQEAIKLVKAGSAAPFDVKRDEAARAQAEQQLLEARNRAGLARIRLFTLIDRPDQGESLEAASELPPPPAEELEAALARRYDLTASRWGAEAARARVSLADSQDAPNLGLQTDYVTRNQVAFSPARQWTVGLNLQVPLYDGGLSETRVLQAREIVEQLQALYEQARRNASLELQSLVLELSNRYQRLDVTERNLAAAAEAARIARLRYQNGLSTNVELLDAEAAFTAAQQEKVSARYQYLQALARYRRAAAL